MSSILNDWEKFCDELKASGKLITENSDNEVHQLEGFRYLLRLLRLSTEMYLSIQASIIRRFIDYLMKQEKLVQIIQTIIILMPISILK